MRMRLYHIRKRRRRVVMKALVTSVSLYLLLQFQYSFSRAATKKIVFINGSVPIAVVSKYSPSFAVGMGLFKYGMVDYLMNPKLLTLVRALGPSHIRMGGTKSDHSHFMASSIDPGFVDDRKKNLDVQQLLHEVNADCIGRIPDKEEFERHVLKAEREMIADKMSKILNGVASVNVSYTASQFDEFMRFVQCANWNLIFGLNLLDRKNRTWDPTNTVELLNYAKSKRYRFDLELGNEPNSYHHKEGIILLPEQVGDGFLTLKSMIAKDSFWKKSPLIGPDVNSVFKKSARKFLQRFLVHAGTVLNAVTFHQYYINSVNATVSNFTDNEILNKLNNLVEGVIKAVSKVKPPIEVGIWLGETSSSYGGGADGLSNSYVAGFMWLDKLGICAAKGVKLVFRQTLLGGYYALIDNNFDPYPDYWLTLLYKKLVGPKVLNSTITSKDGRSSRNTGKFRVYAHCTKCGQPAYRNGAITLYYLNLSKGIRTIRLSEPVGYQKPKLAMAYILTSQPGNITSNEVYLNGKLLEMIDIHTMPPLRPAIIDLQHGQEILLPGMSFGFVVLPDVQAAACLIQRERVDEDW